MSFFSSVLANIQFLRLTESKFKYRHQSLYFKKFFSTRSDDYPCLRTTALGPKEKHNFFIFDMEIIFHMWNVYSKRKK